MKIHFSLVSGMFTRCEECTEGQNLDGVTIPPPQYIPLRTQLSYNRKDFKYLVSVLHQRSR